MTGSLTFAGHSFVVLPSGAVHWPAEAALLVADLHLGRSERLARRGGPLLPPFEGVETLDRLEADLQRTAARRVISLGDAFDDDLARIGLEPDLRARLVSLTARRDWLWIAGNHDPAAPDLPGIALAEHRLGGLWLRHQARAGAGPDLSGHFHPKAEVAGRSRPALLVGRSHMILPAYGHYTGGLDWRRPELRALVGPGVAFLTGGPVIAVPIPADGGLRARR